MKTLSVVLFTSLLSLSAQARQFHCNAPEGSSSADYLVQINDAQDQAQLTEVPKENRASRVIARFEDTVDANVLTGDRGFAFAWKNASIAAGQIKSKWVAEIEVNGSLESGFFCTELYTFRDRANGL
jgi:hypothetical protein